MNEQVCSGPLQISAGVADYGDLAFGLVKILENANFDLESDREKAKESIAKVSSILGLELLPRLTPPTDLTTTRGLAKWQMSRLQEYIDGRIDQNITTKDLSRFMHLSASHFRRTFKKHFNETAHHYVLLRRISHAKHLLVSTVFPLSEIAMNCGFSDQAHLCRIFKKLVGDTPTIWRQYRQQVIATTYFGFTAGSSVKKERLPI